MSDFSYVKDYGLQFNGALVPRKATRRILLHETCGGPRETVQGIHAYHQSNGHKGIDYNICVERDGSVAWGRGLEYCGGSVNNSNASTKGMNDDSVAIVALGNFDVDQMPEAQKEGMKRITRDVAQYYGITEIKGHNEVAGKDYTTCPGKYFPLDEIRQAALAKEEEVEEKPLNQTAIEDFVRRLYHNVLNRGADIEGWNHWMNSLLGRQITPKEAAYGIIFSGEEMAQKEANEQFVVELYLGLLGRMPDGNAEGWSSGLYKDMSREDVFNGIVGSAEFQNIEKNMGF